MRVAFWGQRHLLPGDTVVCLCLLPGTYKTNNKKYKCVVRRAEEGDGHVQKMPELGETSRDVFFNAANTTTRRTIKTDPQGGRTNPFFVGRGSRQRNTRVIP